MKDVNSYGWKAVIGSSVGYAMDGFDLLILGFMLTLISGDLGLSTGQAGSLVTWTLIGAVLGGFIFGTLSDKYGRVRVLTWTIVLFAVFTGLCAFAQGYWDLLIYRTIAGIGLGGEFGIGMALAAAKAMPIPNSPCESDKLCCSWLAIRRIGRCIINTVINSLHWMARHVYGWYYSCLCGVVLPCETTRTRNLCTKQRGK